MSLPDTKNYMCSRIVRLVLSVWLAIYLTGCEAIIYSKIKDDKKSDDRQIVAETGSDVAEVDDNQQSEEMPPTDTLPVGVWGTSKWGEAVWK